jgi:hypothetical protein
LADAWNGSSAPIPESHVPIAIPHPAQAIGTTWKGPLSAQLGGPFSLELQGKL